MNKDTLQSEVNKATDIETVVSLILNADCVSEKMKKHVKASYAQATQETRDVLNARIQDFAEVARDKYAIRKYVVLASLATSQRVSEAMIKDSIHVIAQVIAHYADKKRELTVKRIFQNANHATNRQAEMTFRCLANLSACEQDFNSSVKAYKLSKNNKIVNNLIKTYLVS